MRYCLFAALILLLLVGLVGPARPPVAAAAPRGQTTAPCYAAAVAALTKRGAIYSQGGELAGDPIDPVTLTPYPRTGPNSFDCSGLVWWAYAQAGVTIGSTTYQQQNNGAAIPCTLADLRGAATTCWAVGDLAFLRYTGGQHVAIYVGDGLFMDCYNHDTGCILHNPALDDFYQAHWWQARRIVEGCAGLTTNPGTPSDPAPTAPSWEEVPPLLLPIDLAFPWTCSTAGGTGQTVAPYAVPPDQWWDIRLWVAWLAVQIWNIGAMPVVCWLIALANAALAVVEVVVNGVAILSINSLWRLLVWVVQQLAFFWVGASALLDRARVELWLALEPVAQGLAQLASLGPLLADLAAWLWSLIVALWDLLTAVFGAVAYGVAVLMAVLPELLMGMLNPQPNEHVIALQTNIFFLLFRDSFQGFLDSRLGWVWGAIIALVYVQCALWVIGVFSEANT
ncbi:NlpC/P60 family protein [Chloroflexia bacterium SDU3-3]|nr:NlpC/P60 family protein [Chloroflexia bacterium SDU3-3]